MPDRTLEYCGHSHRRAANDRSHIGLCAAVAAAGSGVVGLLWLVIGMATGGGLLDWVGKHAATYFECGLVMGVVGVIVPGVRLLAACGVILHLIVGLIWLLIGGRSYYC